MSDHSHEILVVKKHTSGAEEWYCPTCARRFIVQWSPEYQCIVLNQGDETAIYNMGRGALVLLAPVDVVSEERLAPWQQWIEHLDLESQIGEEPDLG